jgi:HK97 family phage major capsid protein
MADSALDRLVEKQNTLWNRMQELQTRSESEAGWTEEDRSNWDAAEADLTTVSGDIDRLQRSAKLEKVDYSQVVEARADGEVETPEAATEKRAKEYADAFENYMRGGLERCSNEQRSMLLDNHVTQTRAAGEATSSAGGYLVPPGYRQVLVEALKAYGGLMNLANVITTSTGQPLQWPTNDDTANVGAILAENPGSPIATTPDLTFGSRTLGAYTYTSNAVLVSLQLLQDSVFDLNTFVPKKLGQRIGRATAAHFISGTGTGQPLGITTGVTAGKTGATGQTLTVTYDDLIDLEHSIDPAYRTGDTRWLMNDATLKVIRKVKDTQGRPIWLPIPTPGFPATINGYEYTIDQGMPVPAANAKSILFGDFKQGYIIRQVLDVQMVRLTERWADYLQVGFFAFMRLDATPDAPQAIRAYVHSAT